MARRGEVVFRFLADVRDVARGLGQAEGEISSFGRRAQNVFQSSFGRVTSSISSRFGAVGKEAESALNGLATSGIAAGGAMTAGVAAGAAAGGAAIVAFAQKGIREYIQLTDAVRGVQRVTGASAQDASRFVAVERALNIETSAGN
jgi:hypothetical protein